MTNVEKFCEGLEALSVKYQHEPEGPALRRIVASLREAIELDKQVDLQAIDEEVKSNEIQR